MNLSFYTIDDLRLGPNLWTETRFDAVQDVLVTDCLAQPPLAGGLGGAGGGTEMCLRPEGSLLPGP